MPNAASLLAKAETFLCASLHPVFFSGSMLVFLREVQGISAGTKDLLSAGRR